jgi:hypothetical protein
MRERSEALYTRNHFANQRADGAVGESLKAPLVSVNGQRNSTSKYWRRADGGNPKRTITGYAASAANIAASTTLMEFRSPAEDSIRLATPRIRILGTFFSGGVAGAVDIESAHFIGSASGSNMHPTNGFCSSCIVLSKTHIIPAAIASGNYPSNQLPTFARSPFNAASEPSPKPHYPALARLHPGC